jgi:excisionase family DNA binding protein
VPFSISTDVPALTSVASQDREFSGLVAVNTGIRALGNQYDGEAPLVVTIKEATRLLSVGRTTLYKLMNDGHLTAVKIGGASRVLRTSLDEFVQRAKV